MASRPTALLVIAAAHAGVIALMGPLSSLSDAAADRPPLEVSLATELPRALELADLAPHLISLVPPAMEAPSIDLPEEPVGDRAITIGSEQSPVASSSGQPMTIDEVRYLLPPRPRYPNESRRSREEGLVLLLVTIDEHGRATHVEVKRSSGHARLDAAARDAVERALFKPYVENGIARTVLATIPIEFNYRSGHGAGPHQRRS